MKLEDELLKLWSAGIKDEGMKVACDHLWNNKRLLDKEGQSYRKKKSNFWHSKNKKQKKNIQAPWICS